MSRKIRTDLGNVECVCEEIKDIDFLTMDKTEDKAWTPPQIKYKFFFRCKSCGKLFTIDIDE